MPVVRVWPEQPAANISPFIKWILVASFLVGVTAIGIPVFENMGFPLDDSWIHQVIGRNTAEFGVPGFVPGKATAGSTSALWPWVIALNYRILPFLAPVTFLFAVNACCLAIILFAVFKSAVRDGLRPLEVAILALLPALTGNFLWLVASGMEHLMFIAAAFLAAYAWLAPKPRSNATASIAGVLCGLCVATRPEAIAFVPVFLVAGRLRGRAPRQMILFVIPVLLFLALVLLTNLWASNSLMPATLGGRRWLYFADNPVSFWMQRRYFLISWASRIVNYFFGIDVSLHGVEAIAAVVFVLMAFGVIRLVRKQAFHTLFLLSLAAANFGIYSLMLPVGGNAMRYQAMSLIYVYPLIALGGFELFGILFARLARNSAARATVANRAVFATLFLIALVSTYAWSRIADAGIRHINATEVRMGKWIAENVPRDALVASFDIGGIAYFGNVRVIDLGGLTDPDFVPYLYSGRSSVYVREHQASLLVLPTNTHVDEPAGEAPCHQETVGFGFCNPPRVHMRAIMSFGTSADLWKKGFAATANALQSQMLYSFEPI